jgi:hypothetical protein
MKFKDIPQFPRAHYNTHVGWTELEHWIEHMQERGEGIAALDLDPDFQRAHVWTPDQQERYVEYILRGGESGRNIYFNCTGWMRDYRGPFVIVDGKQRLEAVRGFMADRVKAFGHYFSKFEGRLSYEANFNMHVANLSTRAEVLQWYVDFNVGGTPHTDAEIARVRALLEAEKAA